MHIEAPTLPVTHRAQIVSALAALAVAGGAFGAITIATNDDGSTKSSQAPIVTKVDTSRVLDGSPLVRGVVVATTSHPSHGGSSFLPKSGLPKSGDAQPSALQPPKGQPEGFHGH